MTSLAALTHIGIVHYMLLTCCFTCLFLAFRSKDANYDKASDYGLCVMSVGLFINLAIVSISMVMWDEQDSQLIIILSCCIYLIVGYYLFYTMYFIIEPSIDYELKSGE